MTQASPRKLTALTRRFRDLPLGTLPDRRSSRGHHRHRFKSLISALFVGMLTARRSLPQVERLTATLTPRMRRLTGIRERISDTKLRDFQRTLEAEDLRPLMHHQIKAEHRRGTLRCALDLPFGVAAVDGKGLGICAPDDPCASVQRVEPSNGEPYGKLMVHRTTLISSAAAVCIDQRPIPGDTNEIGAFPDALDELLDAYGHTSLFGMLMADAGNASAAIATQINDAHLAYGLRLKSNHGGIFVDAVAALNKATPRLEIETLKGPKGQRTRTIRRLYRVEACDWRPYGWANLRQWVLVETEVIGPDGERTSIGQRIWASNLPMNALSDRQWLHLTRAYWRCENNNHWTADVFFREDARRQPWTGEGRTLLTLANLRMLALNVIAIRRSMSRDPGHRNQPLGWQDVLELALVWVRTGIEYQAAQAMIG